MAKVDFDAYAEQYTQILGNQTRFFSGGDDDYFARIKAEWAQRCRTLPTQRVLDFGCGIGRSLPALKKAFPNAQVAACDVSRKSLEWVSQQHPDVLCCDPQELSWVGSVDVIVAACVFHHIEPLERDRWIQWCWDALAPGGQLMIFEHNPYNPMTRYLVRTCPFDADAVLLSRHETQRRLTQAGFVSLQSAYYLFFPPRFKQAIEQERRFKNIPLGGQYIVCGEKPNV